LPDAPAATGPASTSATFSPRDANQYAALAPLMPAPITTKSVRWVTSEERSCHSETVIAHPYQERPTGSI